jgi:hypothetical protein
MKRLLFALALATVASGTSLSAAVKNTTEALDDHIERATRAYDGPAECHADLFYWSYNGGQKFNQLATTTFNADGR